jgi:hypothetical protein
MLSYYGKRTRTGVSRTVSGLESLTSSPFPFSLSYNRAQNQAAIYIFITRALSIPHPDLKTLRLTTKLKHQPLSLSHKMAVIPGVPGLEVTIVCDGEALKEYPDIEWTNHLFPNVPLHARSANYVECKSDKEYSIQVKLTPGYVFENPTMGFRFLVDGKSAGFWTCDVTQFHNFGHQRTHTCVGRSKQVSASHYKHYPFKFSSITKGMYLSSL